MKGRVGWMAMAVLFLTAVAHATTLSVTDIKVAQRYPWNGLVDITYTVNCDDPTKDVWVYPVGYDADNDKTVAMMPANLTGDGVGKAVKSGTHRMTWDMATAMGKGYNRAAFSVKMHAFCDAAPYMVIDLSSGSESERYEVSYLAEEPEGGWGEEYLTTKMVFRLILPGRSITYANKNTTIDYPYYFAIYPITNSQYVHINGGSSNNPRHQKSEISYALLRGKVLGSKWPTYQQVDADSLSGKMRLRTGMTVDIPTCAEWYRAVSADFMHTSCNKVNPWGVYFQNYQVTGYIYWVHELCRRINSNALALFGQNGTANLYIGRSIMSNSGNNISYTDSYYSLNHDSVKAGSTGTGSFIARLVVYPVSK